MSVSDEARDAAERAAWPGLPECIDADEARRRTDACLDAAHDPALGIKRSVCLEAVDAWLERTGAGTQRRNALLREFGVPDG